MVAWAALKTSATSVSVDLADEADDDLDLDVDLDVDELDELDDEVETGVGDRSLLAFLFRDFWTQERDFVGFLALLDLFDFLCLYEQAKLTALTVLELLSEAFRALVKLWDLSYLSSLDLDMKNDSSWRVDEAMSLDTKQRLIGSKRDKLLLLS